MTRQQRITREQVAHKRYDARTRVLKAADRALNANTAEDYDQAINDGVKAAKDYEIWSKVLAAL